MARLVLKSWLLLLYFDCVMRFRTFRSLHGILRDQGVLVRNDSGPSDEQVCDAVDLACVFYLKRVQCLQRSAATTVLLRRHGRRAELVLGAQLLPFRSHAWVEIEGRVVNDKPYVTEIFLVLERC